MHQLHDTVSEAAIGVGVTDRPGGLAEISEPGIAAMIWRRQHAEKDLGWLATLGPEALPRLREILAPAAVGDAVHAACLGAGTPAGPGRDRLIDDIALLGEVFSGLMRAPLLRLRLDVVKTNACRKFHIDAVTMRLVCTYRGTGTQYGFSRDGAEPDRVFTVPTGSPIVLRGTRCPILPASGLLHRSPPIEGTGETRLVLVLDPIIDPDYSED